MAVCACHARERMHATTTPLKPKQHKRKRFSKQWQTEHVDFAVDFALHDCLRLNVRPCYAYVYVAWVR